MVLGSILPWRFPWKYCKSMMHRVAWKWNPRVLSLWQVWCRMGGLSTLTHMFSKFYIINPCNPEFISGSINLICLWNQCEDLVSVWEVVGLNFNNCEYPYWEIKWIRLRHVYFIWAYWNGWHFEGIIEIGCFLFWNPTPIHSPADIDSCYGSLLLCQPKLCGANKHRKKGILENFTI